MNVLVDTSVWVNHFKSGNQGLVALLEQDRVHTHPMIVAELACGTPPEPRTHTLDAISQLKSVQQISLNELMDFIEREKLYGLGCGVIDLMLLGSTLLTTGLNIWTLDKRMAALADRFSISYESPHC